MTAKTKELPKLDKLTDAARTLTQLAEFIEANATYHRPGAEHIRAVVGYLGWAGHNLHLARQDD